MGDHIEIRSTATNRRGTAEAVGIDDSSLVTEGGDDLIGIHASAYGRNTTAWALRDGNLSTGPGRDSLRINANARGNTTGTIAAFGALSSQIAMGDQSDRVDIRAHAVNRRGTAEAFGLDDSTLVTEGGDDLIRIHAHAKGKSTNAWALRGSILNTGPGSDSI